MRSCSKTIEPSHPSHHQHHQYHRRNSSSSSSSINNIAITMTSPAETPKPIRETTHPPLILNPNKRVPLLKTATHHPDPEPVLPVAHSKHHPTRKQQQPQPAATAASSLGEAPPGSGSGSGYVYFIGTATTVIEYGGARVLTDPNFLHAGDHVHLGPGVTARRLTNPAVPDLASLPPVDCVLLSHYHEDHFDRDVERQLSRDIPIVTTPHAKGCLTDAGKGQEGGSGGPFRRVWGVDAFEGVLMPIVEEEIQRDTTESGTEAATGEGKKRKRRAVRVTGMPGKHVPPGPLAKVNELLGAVPPTNGWLVELGWTTSTAEVTERSEEPFETGYRIYISGDTLMVDELKEIPKRLRGDKIDLMLVHLGGTTIPGPNMPLIMVTMDGKQGVQLMRLVDPDVTVPIHFDDYDVFCSPLDDFKKEVEAAELGDKVVYLNRGDQFEFSF
ncbi:hypothetical protein VTI28DRAFT_2336 [Corynascus sepedonium]